MQPHFLFNNCALGMQHMKIFKDMQGMFY